MSDQNLRRLGGAIVPADDPPRRPLGRHLVDEGVITQAQLVRALEMQIQIGATIGEILVAEGWALPEDIHQALAQQHRLQRVDLANHAPEARLMKARPRDFWLKHRILPWLRLGNLVLIATSRPDRFDALRGELRAGFENALPVLADDGEITEHLANYYSKELAAFASTRVAAKYSCRNWTGTRRHIVPVLLALSLVACFLAAAKVTLSFLSLLAVFFLTLFAVLRFAGFAAQLANRGVLTASTPCGPVSQNGAPLPRVSVLVPLFREREIAGALLQRLNRLSYPKALLEILLVLEDHDEITRETLKKAKLPDWMRVIEVPQHGGLTTKPRAMNYALDFCRGDIVGVWDAEDAPMPDQLELVARRFAEEPDDVVCVQGILDYYNPRTNWLARCFTIEYSSWFRIVLPGIARLGLVVPLGGTTLFFRRDKLEELGGWDAHNVTEDADLGVRLCRAGYRTEMIETVTYEEANCRLWPWIKQRSRWLKGFMVTYLVHMRQPGQLLRDLGWKRFLGMQAFFLGTLGHFLLAPFLWGFWMILFGLPHPLPDLLPDVALTLAITALMLFELMSIAIGALAVNRPGRRGLILWVPSLILYYPFGVIAAYKALYELVWCPFYWDKTRHGHAGDEIGAG